MQTLRRPIWVTAIVILLFGLSSLSPALVSSVYGYEVKDEGVLFTLAASVFAFFVILWGIAGNPEKHGDLASNVVIGLAIFVVFFLIGWARGLYTFRNVVIPVVIDVVLGAWIWSSRPKS